MAQQAREKIEKPWLISKEQILQDLKTDAEEGLSQNEAKGRLKEFGKNELAKDDHISILKILGRQINNIIVWVLLGSAITAALFAQFIDAISIGTIIVLNTLIGLFQEYTAERSLQALKKMEKPKSEVIRDGETLEIASKEIVPGDIVLLEAGDEIPADGRIIEATQLQTQEAALTGESLPVEKIDTKLNNEDIPLAERSNMAYMGTTLVKGKGKIIVTATGMDTELGKVATLIKKEQRLEYEKTTPLQKRIQHLGHRLLIVSLLFVVIISLLLFFRQQSIFDAILVTISLVVSSIPEAFPAIMTITLALGVKKMAERNVLIRKLPSVETLGCTSVICSDKTGTLTKNEMTATHIWISQVIITISGVGYTPEGEYSQDNTAINPQENENLMQILSIATLCNNATLDKENSKYKIIGDPTEGAMLVAAQKADIEKKSLEEQNPLLEEIPFDSERKRMSTLRETDEGNILYTKGSPETILELSTQILINNEVVELSQKYKEEILEANEQFMNKGLRVLAFAYKPIQKQTVDEDDEQDLIFVGLMGMIDPPRDNVKEALQKCESAGIKVIMITGDQKGTAIAIARDLKILKKDSLAITGTELEEMNDKELSEKLTNITVYARASVEHKIRVVKFWKEKGEIVAVTGDGVNDAPAVKSADIGISMGITGTDVTKEASDMVITDDNFVSIVAAVEEGRGIYDNIKKFVNYLTSSNIAELLIIFIAALVGFTNQQGHLFIPLLPLHLLWINLLTDGFPALALAVDPFDKTIMERLPRDPNQPILTTSILIQILYVGILVTLGTLVASYIGLQLEPSNTMLAHTMAFTTLVMLELIRIYTIRRQSNIPLFTNYWLGIAIIISLGLQLLVVYVPPLQVLFETTPLGLTEWGIILGITSATFVLTIITQFIVEKYMTRIR